MDESKLLSYLKGEASNEECMHVEAWCEASPDNRRMLEQLYYVIFTDERLAVMENVNADQSLSKLKVKIKQKEAEKQVVNSNMARWKRCTVPVAAFLTGLILSTGIALWPHSEKPSRYMVATDPGQRAQAILPDGTRVWLNSATQLSYKSSSEGDERRVDLTGEAYFEVTRNEKVPFVVNSKNIKTCVLGTKFNVRARAAEDKVVTTLLKGSVRIDMPEREGSGFFLKPGQTLNVDTRTHKAELTESKSPNEVLLWIQGKLHFEKSTLLEITRCLEKHFDVHFAFVNDQLKNERFTCDFATDDDIEQILTVLSLTKRFNYKKDAQLVSLFKR